MTLGFVKEITDSEWVLRVLQLVSQLGLRAYLRIGRVVRSNLGRQCSYGILRFE